MLTKIDELNDKWLDHCQRTPEMKQPEGRNEFKREIQRLIDKAKILIITTPRPGTTFTGK